MCEFIFKSVAMHQPVPDNKLNFVWKGSFEESRLIVSYADQYYHLKNLKLDFA